MSNDSVDNVLDFEGFVDGSRVWVRGDDNTWVEGSVIEFSGTEVKLRVAGAETWFPTDKVQVNKPMATCGSDDAPVRFVTVYAVTRHYGGPQEGGWWWNRFERVTHLPLLAPGDLDEVKMLRQILAARYKDEGNIYSVRGGVEYHVLNEDELGCNEVRTSGGYS